MKFLCLTEFVHSGVALYYEGKEYPLTEAQANELVNLDKNKKPLGALRYFTPTDDEARKFVAKLGGKIGGTDLGAGNGTEGQGTEDGKGTPTEETATEPTRADLLAKAVELGLNLPKNISTAKLIAAIAEAKQK